MQTESGWKWTALRAEILAFDAVRPRGVQRSGYRAAMHRIGIDLGGTKIEIAALDRNGRERPRHRIATPQGDYEATVAAVAALVRAAETELGGRATIGVGIPGALSQATGLVKNANSTCLIGRPLKQDLERALAREVRIANDANCFA